MARKLFRRLMIVNELGLHARSAAGIAKLAGSARANVWIAREDQVADATSILDILSLACAKGTQITVRIDDPADGHVLDRIAALVEGGFGE